MTGPLAADAIERLTLLTDPWLSCDDCFDQVDSVAETVLGRSGRMSEEFRVHLMGCSACHDETLALMQLIGPEYALDPAAAEALMSAAVREPNHL